MSTIVSILLNAVVLLLTASVVSGMEITSFIPAILGAIVLGIINSLIRPLFVILTFPITVLTFGLFLFVVNALMLKFAAGLVPGFQIVGLWPAIVGAFLVSLLNWLLLGLFVED